jgi:hypothetical protein
MGLFDFLGAAAPAYAQEEKQKQDTKGKVSGAVVPNKSGPVSQKKEPVINLDEESSKNKMQTVGAAPETMMYSSDMMKEAVRRIKDIPLPSNEYLIKSDSDLVKQLLGVQRQEQELQKNPWREIDWSTPLAMLQANTGINFGGEAGKPRITSEYLGDKKNRLINQLAKFRGDMSKQELEYAQSQFSRNPTMITAIKEDAAGTKQVPTPPPKGAGKQSSYKVTASKPYLAARQMMDILPDLKYIREMVDKHGAEIVGDNVPLMEQAFTRVQVGLKKAAELGAALSKTELPLLLKQLRDPTSVKTALSFMSSGNSPKKGLSETYASAEAKLESLIESEKNALQADEPAIADEIENVWGAKRSQGSAPQREVKILKSGKKVMRVGNTGDPSKDWQEMGSK